ncbi:MAG: hypothetical protein [Caudoviricetes sp.]|nr:MAG: hypothetical protein [Caudoviricetes sp.]
MYSISTSLHVIWNQLTMLNETIQVTRAEFKITSHMSYTFLPRAWSTTICFNNFTINVFNVVGFHWCSLVFQRTCMYWILRLLTLQVQSSNNTFRFLQRVIQFTVRHLSTARRRNGQCVFQSVTELVDIHSFPSRVFTLQVGIYYGYRSSKLPVTVIVVRNVPLTRLQHYRSAFVHRFTHDFRQLFNGWISSFMITQPEEVSPVSGRANNLHHLERFDQSVANLLSITSFVERFCDTTCLNSSNAPCLFR